MVMEYLAGFGIEGVLREQPLSDEESIGSLEMMIERYEEERPDAASAPRHGDERVLAHGGFEPPQDFDAEMAELVNRVEGQG